MSPAELWYPDKHGESKVAVAATDEVFYGPVQPGRIHRIHNIAVENEDNSATDIRLLVTGGGAEILLKEFNTVTAAVLMVFGGDIELTEGEKLIARFTGVTIGDNLKMYCVGSYLDTASGGSLYPF